MVEALCQRPDIDVDRPCDAGETPLMVAARRDHMGVVEHLLQAEADLLLRDRYGQTALDLASGNGHAAIAERLRIQSYNDTILEHDADLPLANESETRQH